MDTKNSDLEKQLQAIADGENALVMSFIASEVGVRLSPVAFYNTTITIQDLYTIERHVAKLESEGRLPEKLHLVVHTPGGLVYAATKIAKYLQAKFKEIHAYVPYEAASGGTMICLAASKIIMDEASNLTQIDPQVFYQGEYIAAGSYRQAIEDFAALNHNKRPEEMDPPYQQMAQKFDPVINKQMTKIVSDTLSVAFDLHRKATKAKTEEENRKAFNAVFYLANTLNPHEHIIDMDEAAQIGLPVSRTSDELERLKTYKTWASNKLKNPGANHIIDVYCPKGGQHGSGQTASIKKDQAKNPKPQD